MASNAFDQFDAPASAGGNAFDQFDAGDLQARQDEWRKRTGNMDESVPVPSTLDDSQGNHPRRFGIGHMIENASIAAGRSATAGLQDTAADANLVGGGAARLMGGDQQTQDEFFRRAQENSEGAARNRALAHDLSPTGAAAGEVLGLAPLLVGGAALAPERAVTAGRRGLRWLVDAGKHALPVASGIGQVQASRDAIDVLNRGGDAETAEKVYGTSFAANTAGNILPASVGGKVVTRLGTGAVLGGTAALGTQEGLHKVAPEYIAGPSAETALTGAGIGALFSGVMGGHGRTAPTKIVGEKPGIHAKIDPESDVESRRQAVNDIMSAAGEGDQAAQPDVSATKPPEDWRTKLAAKTDVPDELRQAIGSRFERAEKTLPVFDKDVREIADSVGGTPIVAPLKGVDRATSKIMSDYGGDASQIKDLVRGTIEIPSPDDLPKVEAQLREKYGEPIKFKSSLDPEKPAPFANGYRDLNSVWMINGEPVELQVNVPEMLVAKKKAHPLYAKWQKIERQATNENRDPTPAEKAEMADLDSQQNAIYSEAWDAAMRRMNSSREITSASSRNNEPETGSPSGQVRQTYASSDANRPSGNTPNTAAELNAGSGAERVSGGADMGVSSEEIVPRGSADWEQFSEDSGTLGIPRSAMPQIKRKDRGSFIQYLASKGIASEKTTVPASDLRPTQAEYSPAKVARFADSGLMNGARDVLISSDGYVLDGHHQAVAHRNAGTEVPVIRLDAPIRELLKAADEFPSVRRSEGASGRQDENQGVSNEQPKPTSERPESTAEAGQRPSEGSGGRAVRSGARADGDAPTNENATDYTVVEAPISELTLSEDVPQFKKGANDKGVVEPLGGTFDRRGVGPIQVWRRRDGKMEVISGRHRLDLARRSGEKTIPAQIYNEADGFSRDQAVTLDAELNIRDGQGKVADYVQYFKHNPAFDGPEGRQIAESRGLLARAPGRRAYTIASKGDDDLVAAHRAGEIKDEAATRIAEAAPNDGRLQAVGMKAVQDGKSITNAVNTMRAVQALAADRGPAQTSGDMFGLDDSAMREAEGMAKVASSMQRAIDEQIRSVKGAANRPDLAKRHGVDVRDPEGLKRRIQDLEAEKQRLSNWHTDPELVAKIRDAMNGDKPAMSLRSDQDRSAPALSNEEMQRVAAGVMGVDTADRRVVIAPFEALPKPIHDAAKAQGHAAGDVEAVNWHGKTYLVEGVFHSPAQVQRAIFHEYFTHHGLRVKYKNQLGARLGGLLHDIGGMDGLRELAKKQGIDLSGYENDSKLPHSHQRVMMMDELLAHMSHTTGTLKRKLQEYVGMVRDFLRRHGFADLAKYGETDLAYVLRQAREAALREDSAGAKGSPSFMRRPGAASGDLFGGRDEQAPRQRETAPAVENGDLFGGPTSADRLDAATRERDARRNGADRGGRSDMMAGDGELFAGKRPEQADLAGVAEDASASKREDAQKQWLEKGTESPYFKKWFGESRVVGEDGKPIVVYHGTTDDFSTFDEGMRGKVTRATSSKAGFFFTDSPRVAKSYADHGATVAPVERLIEQANEAGDRGNWDLYDQKIAEAEALEARMNADLDGRNNGQSIMPAYLKIENPLVVDAKGENPQGVGGIDAIITQAKKSGHDGVIIRNFDDAAGLYDALADHYIVFTPEQIKSATGNSGEFGDTADIRFSMRSDLTDNQVEALGKIGVSPKVVPLKVKLREYGNKIQKESVQGIVDQFAPLKDLDMTAYMQARMSRGTDGALEATFFHGTPKLTDGALDVQVDGTGFRGVLADLEGEQDLFFAWIAGNRAEALSKEWVVKADGKVIGRYADKAEANRAAIKMRSERPDELFGGSKSPEITAAPAGRERLFTDHQIAELKKLNQGTMPSGRKRADVYGQANGKFRTYQNAVLKIAEEAGLIDPEQRKVWADQFYVPFYRELDSADGKSQPMHGSASLVRQRAFEQLKGSEKPLNDLFENVMSNWSHLLTSSMRNMAGDKALTAAEKMGMAHEIGSPEKGSVWIMRGGKQVHYRVDDDMLLDALTSLNYNGIKGRAMDAMRLFKHVLTAGVTMSPTFRVRNLARDTMSALAVSDDAGWNPLVNIAQGWKGTGKNAETNIRLLAGGGKIHYGTLLDGQQANNAKRLVREKIAGHDQILDTREKIGNAFKDAWEWWKDVGDKSETINRAVLYENARKAGKNHLEASYEARDLLDFTMGGKWTSVRFLTSTVPFMNARLQGLYKLGKAGRNNPARFAAVTGTVALASALNYLLQKDDPEYQQLPDWVRDTYWPVKFGGKMVFIPKPFEVGAMGSVVERVTELAVGGDDYKAKDFAHTLANIIGDQLSMNPIPQMIRPAAEAAANYDIFRGRDIDNMGDERLSPKYRTGPTTSAGAIAVGRAINVSPKRVEHMVRGYFGWLGQQALNVSDLLARDAMDLPSNPRRDVSKVDNMFGIGDFVKDTKGEYSKYVDRLYQLQDRVNRVYADLNHARKTGDVEGVADLRDAEELRLRPVVKGGAKELATLRRRIKAVGNDRNLSAHEKRVKIDELRQRQNDIARRTDQRVRELESRE